MDAGGAFSLLIHARDDAPELVDVHRFAHAWEKTASLELRHGRQAGFASVLIAETRENVTALNVRARADLIRDGTPKPGPEITLSDRSATAKPGPSTPCATTGSVTIRPPGPRFGNSIVLPADQVAEHVDLGYVVTAHRAQGITTDTAHVLVEPTTTRENRMWR